MRDQGILIGVDKECGFNSLDWSGLALVGELVEVMAEVMAEALARERKERMNE